MRAVLLAATLLFALPASAQTVAVPYYGAPAFAAALLVHSQQPKSQVFAREAQALSTTTDALCQQRSAAALDAARAQWRRATSAWEALAAIATGPALQQRAARELDFQPARPALIDRAVESLHGVPSRDPEALQKVGAPARGLPALEWLLWEGTPRADAPQCDYALRVADDIARRASALARAFAAMQIDDLDAGFAEEAVNQWLAGLEGLRWRALGKPLAAGRRDEFVRATSASSAASWRTTWRALRELAIGAAPDSGFGPPPDVPRGIVSLEATLRGRGHNAIADRWSRAVRRADAAMARLDASAAAPNARAAVAGLGDVKRLMQAEVAPALQVALGFADADGD